MTEYETYNCETPGCGRKFPTNEKLLTHIKRRHSAVLNAQSDMLTDLYKKIDYIENNTTNVQIEPELKAEIEYSISINSEIRPNVSIITDEMIGIGTIYMDYDEVDEVFYKILIFLKINLEDKSLICFRNKNTVNFTYLLYVTSLNISKNFIRDISLIKEFPLLKHLNLSFNKIDDITILENLTNLQTLEAENNEIISISSLIKCKNIKILLLKNNNIKFENSTFKTLQNLNKLYSLSIDNNPFIKDVFGSKYLLIYKYPQLEKLNCEDITELDREVALKFIMENKLESKIEDTIRIVNKNVTSKCKIFEKELKSSDKKLIPLQLNKKMDIMNDDVKSMKEELEKIKIENKNLKEKNKIYEFELQSLKLELENSLSLNKEYEKLVQENSSIEINKIKDEEKKKLKSEVEMWKREYCDLLDKSMSTNVSTSRLLSSGDKFRPQTAKVEFNKSNKILNSNYDNFNLNKYEETIEDLSKFKNESFIMKRKNSLDSFSDDIQQEENNISDEEIEDLLRKSMTNLSNLKTEIKYTLNIFM